MIVRDEEATLARCLESAAPYVDDIVVVDTGSADGTVALAEKLGARVIRHEWKEDFSEARNASLEAAASEWLLVLDADDQPHISYYDETHGDLLYASWDPANSEWDIQVVPADSGDDVGRFSSLALW